MSDLEQIAAALGVPATLEAILRKIRWIQESLAAERCASRDAAQEVHSLRLQVCRR